MLPEADESPVGDFHTPVHEMHKTRNEDAVRVQIAMHEEPTPLWKQVVLTNKLHAGVFVSGNNRWYRYPTRNMRPLGPMSSHFQTTTAFITGYYGTTVNMDINDGTYTVFHMALLTNLVSAHPQAPGSAGILVDAGMRNGSPHGDGIGVYVYASPPFDLFTEGDQWCMLELKVRPCLTRVQGGSRGRYVLKSDQSTGSVGAPCPDCQVMAVLHMYKSLPNFMKF